MCVTDCLKSCIHHPVPKNIFMQNSVHHGLVYLAFHYVLNRKNCQTGAVAFLPVIWQLFNFLLIKVVILYEPFPSYCLWGFFL